MNDELEKLLAEATRHFSLPFQGDEGCMKIWDANMRMIADVRGWGYLTGKGDGALGLLEADAIKAQRDLMHAIVAAVNALPEMLAKVKRLEEALTTIANPATYSHSLLSCCQHTFDDTCELFSDIARAALNQETKP